MTKTDIRSMSFEELSSSLDELGLPKFRTGQIYSWLYEKGVSSFDEMTNLSKEDFFRGVSKPVNEELAKLFIRLDLMEQTGFGIPRVTQSYGREAFEFLDFFLRVTIPFAFEIAFDFWFF